MNLVTRLSSFLRSALRKKHLVSALIVVLGIGVLFYGVPVLAQQTGATATVATENTLAASIQAGTSSANCGGAPGGAAGAVGACITSVIGVVVTFIFSIISFFLSKLLLLLTGVLITFARYNKFNLAPPVQIGWVIARDLANMFFIIVLLISAFMTIIGQAEDYGFHYSKVIPKLLGAAILVNFSKTIIMLMIDASQVVTLTFISAFEGTIAGNLIQGLGITNMVRLQGAAPGGAAAEGSQIIINVINICLAYLLSIFLLTTAVAIIILYVGYFIVRIVGLWMILIVSPFMFLVGSLPKSVGGMLSSITGEAWGKLTSFLTGGPLIAFFLWVTFATIQQTAQSGLANSDIGFDFSTVDAVGSTVGFITRIGTSGQLASFIVGVVMLGVGFSVATKTATSVGLGGMVKTVTGYKEKAFSALSRSPLTMTRGAANMADRKYGLTSRFAGGMAMGRKDSKGFLAGAGGLAGDALRLVPGVGGALAIGAAGAVAGRRAGLMADEKKSLDERMGKLDRLPPAERVKALREMRSGRFDDTIGGVSLVERQHEELSKEDNRKELRKQLEAEEKAKLEEGIEKDEAAYRVANPTASAADVTAAFAGRRADLKNQSTALAGKRLVDEENARVQKIRDFANTAGDTVKTEALDKEIKRRMAFTSASKYDEQVKKLLDDPSGFKDIDPEQFKDGRFALAFMRQAGVTDAGATKIDPLLLESLKTAVKDQKELVTSIDLAAKQIQGNSGVSNSATIENSTRQKDLYDAPRLYSTNGSGEAIYSKPETDAIRAITATGSRAAGTALDATRQTALKEALAAGLSMGQIVQMMEKDATGSATGDGMVMAAVASMSGDAAVPDAAGTRANQDKVIKEVSELLELARTNKATQEQRTNIAASLVSAAGGYSQSEIIENAFSKFGSLSGDSKAQATALLVELGKLEDGIRQKLAATPGSTPNAQEKNILSGLDYIRNVVLPAEKLTKGDKVTLADGTVITIAEDTKAAPSGAKNAIH